MLNVKLKSASLKLRARQGCLLSLPWLKILDIVARAIRKEKKIQTGKKVKSLFGDMIINI